MKELITGCISGILTKYAEPIAQKATNYVKDEWEKFKVDFDFVFLKYLNNAYEKYSKVKTILYKTEPKNFYDFFECPLLKKQNEICIRPDDINHIYDISNFLIVQGSGGIGKSTLMKYLFLNELSNKNFIPIFIELKDLNDMHEDYEICDFVFEKLNNLGSTLDKKYLQYALKSGCFLFFLDGYDEIVTEKRDLFFKNFNDFCDKYSDNYYILSSRPYSEFVEFQRFTVLEICDFSKEQAISLISKIDYDTEVKNRFINALDERLYSTHKSFASNPLLLNIMLLTFDNYAEIPEKLHLFYANAFETLYFKHDATKAGFHREMHSKLTYDSFKKIFSEFCFITYFNGKIEFSYEELIELLKKTTIKEMDSIKNDVIYDLVNSVCVLYREGLNYKFTHRSFQEYFTAVFLKELSDHNMKTMGLQLIHKDVYRMTNDNVFDMLYDMAESRVEQNILLPLLEEVEQTYEKGDKYDFYFTKLEPIIVFHTAANNTFCGTGLVMRTGDTKVQFLYNFVRFYKNSKDTLSAEKSLFEIFSKKNNERIYMMEYINDVNIYSLFKNTWIGESIDTISKLSSILKQKKTDTELDLNKLLT